MDLSELSKGVVDVEMAQQPGVEDKKAKERAAATERLIKAAEKKRADKAAENAKREKEMMEAMRREEVEIQKQEAMVEAEEARAAVAKMEKLQSRFNVKTSVKLSNKSTAADIFDALKDVEEQVAVLRGKGAIRGLLEGSATFLESLGGSEVPFFGRMKLHGLAGAVQQSPKTDQIAADLCVKYAYLFREVSPEMQAVLHILGTAFLIHTANSSPDAAARIARAERAREGMGRPVEDPDLLRRFSDL